MAKVLFNGTVAAMSGKIGTSVMARGRTGQVVRQRVKGRNPRTVVQVSTRNNLTTAAKAYKILSSANVAAWVTAATGITKHNRLTGQSYNPTAENYYVSLFAKLLQVTPGSASPTTPPASAFLGDSLTITGSSSGAGNLTFTASAANSANTKTEFLVQTLKSANRTPTAKGYRSFGFQAFAGGTLTKSITIASGTYALAYRYVNTVTGQATPPTLLGKFSC